MNSLNKMDQTTRKWVLVTGATGYVGGRLLGRLQESGLAIHCMARNPAYPMGRVAPKVEVVHGDVTEPASLDEAFRGIDTAFYLVSCAAATRVVFADGKGLCSSIAAFNCKLKDCING